MTKEGLEYYFIQMLFCRNKELLMYKNKEVYKKMFDVYCKVYSKLPNDVDKIGMLNDIIELKKSKEITNE